MKKIILLMVLLGLTGCGFVFQDFDQSEHKGLTYGMSKEEVAAKIGQPQKISKMVIDDREYDIWEYLNRDRLNPEEVNALGVTYSKIFFYSGKLVQRDKDRVYGQPAYEYLESIDPASPARATKIVEQNENLK